MPSLYVDSSNTPNKYSESKLENLLLEYLFKDTDRKAIHSKVEKRLFKQERYWKKIPFPHGAWLRDVLLKIISNIKTKNMKEHIIEHFGKKSDNPHKMWLSLDMKNFPDDFTIDNLKNSGQVDNLVGKTSLETRKILDKRFKLSEDDKKEILEEVYDKDNVKVIFQPKMVHQKSTGKKGPSKNITEAILIPIIHYEIYKDDIFNDNNIEYNKIGLNVGDKETSTEVVIELDTTDWPIILDFKKNEAATVAKLKEFWNKENIELPDDIYNPYVNYQLWVKMIVNIPAALDPNNEIKIKIQLSYQPISEIRIIGQDKEKRYNAAREAYLGRVKDRFDFIKRTVERMPENNEEE